MFGWICTDHRNCSEFPNVITDVEAVAKNGMTIIFSWGGPKHPALMASAEDVRNVLNNDELKTEVRLNSDKVSGADNRMKRKIMRERTIAASQRITRSSSGRKPEVREEDLHDVVSISTDGPVRADGNEARKYCDDEKSIARFDKMLQLARTDLAQKTKEQKIMDATVVDDFRGGPPFDPSAGKELRGQLLRIPKSSQDFVNMAMFANKGVSGAYWRSPRPTMAQIKRANLTLDEALTICGRHGFWTPIDWDSIQKPPWERRRMLNLGKAMVEDYIHPHPIRMTNPIKESKDRFSAFLPATESGQSGRESESEVSFCDEVEEVIVEEIQQIALPNDAVGSEQMPQIQDTPRGRGRPRLIRRQSEQSAAPSGPFHVEVPGERHPPTNSATRGRGVARLASDRDSFVSPTSVTVLPRTIERANHPEAEVDMLDESSTSGTGVQSSTPATF
jgi:hypothetical protein